MRSLILINLILKTLLSHYLRSMIESLTGQEGIFALKEPTWLILGDANAGLGISPGMIRAEEIRFMNP